MIVGVYGMRDPDELNELISKDEILWPCIQNCEGKHSRAWGVSRWPANFLIDQDGVVQLVNKFDEAELSDAINALAREDEDRTN